MIPRILLSNIIFVGIIVAAMSWGNENPSEAIAAFVDLPSLLVVLGVVVSGTLWSFPVHDISQAFMDACSEKELDEDRAFQSHRVFHSMAGYAIGGGLIGTVIGLVKMLKDLDDPTAIGPAMAVALLTIFYGVLLGEISFKSMANSCLSKNTMGLSRQHNRGFITLYMSLIGVFILVASFLTMVLSFASFE